MKSLKLKKKPIHLTLCCIIHLHEISSLWCPHAEHCALFPAPLVIWIHNACHHLQCNVAASSHSWERLQKSYQVELRVKNTFRSASQTFPIYQWKKLHLGCCGCLRFIPKEQLLMLTHDTTEFKTIKSELNHSTRKDLWPWPKLLHFWFSLAIILDTNNCWMCQCNVLVPLMRKWTHYWLDWVRVRVSSSELGSGKQAENLWFRTPGTIILLLWNAHFICILTIYI